ncbi:Alpha/Beta hydrolase protein [Xylaria palmicola]|nr:Alpha/Beta hydrolase protein [Xylaria palmicola]
MTGLPSGVCPAIGSPSARLLLPDHAPPTGSHSYARGGEGAGSPLIICFHGSGETCSPAWDELAAKLAAETRCRVLLYDRGPGSSAAADIAARMWDYVRGTRHLGSEGGNRQDECGLDGPYLLVAHSSGGAFARAFVQHELELPRRRRHSKGSASHVLGLVLVETGQEGGLDPALDELQIRRRVMGRRPVCVVRGNTFIGKLRSLEESERAVAAPEMRAGDHAAARRRVLAAEREMLVLADAEDERLKRRQLGLSRTSRFVQVPECGHHVIRDRPDEVVAAVRWVLSNAVDEEGQGSPWKQAMEAVKRFGLRR